MNHTSNNSLEKILIGPMPPPIGGVSNHILRYSQKFSLPVFKERKKYTLHDFLFILKLKNKDIYTHSVSWKILSILYIKRLLRNRGCRYNLINHNFHSTVTVQKTAKGLIHFFLIKRYIKNCKIVYAVNPDLINKMKMKFGSLNYQIYDPFLPPDESKENEIWKSYESNVKTFIDNHNIILSSGAWQLSFYKNEDLYGFDLLIEMIADLKTEYPQIGLVFFIGNPNYNQEYIQKCRNRIDELNIKESIYIISGQKEMWPIIKQSVLFIRATNTDGDPLSIKEALYFGTKVLASDCCKRAELVSLFKSRNLNSIIQCVKAIVDKI